MYFSNVIYAVSLHQASDFILPNPETSVFCNPFIIAKVVFFFLFIVAMNFQLANSAYIINSGFSKVLQIRISDTILNVLLNFGM